MSYRHLITVIDYNGATSMVDFIMTTDDFEAVERLAVDAAKSFMQGCSHPVVYLRGRDEVASRSWEGTMSRADWTRTYADQTATIKIPVDANGVRRFEIEICDGRGAVVFFKAIEASLDIPAFQQSFNPKAA